MGKNRLIGVRKYFNILIEYSLSLSMLPKDYTPASRQNIAADCLQMIELVCLQMMLLT